MEFSGFLHERGWRADSLWKPRKFVLKGKALRSYSSGQLRSTYIIDAESFITVIRPGVNDHGVKSFADDKHKHVFSICTKIYDPAFRKSKLVLSAPDERALNSWVKVLGECAFDGETIDVPEIWPGAFRNQVNLFQISYHGRNVTDGSHYTSTQLELPPFSSSADTRIGAKSNFKLLKHAWSKSPKIKANVTNTGAAGPLSLQSSGLKLFYTLILVASETMPGQPEHWSDEFSLLWMVTNLRPNSNIPFDQINGQDVYKYTSPSRPFGCEKRKCYFLVFTQPEGLLCEYNIHRIKNNIKVMKNPLDPYKTTNIFSNPYRWAEDMSFHHPAWVCSFYAESRAKAELKGTDASVHLNIQYTIRPLQCLRHDSNETKNKCEVEIDNGIKDGIIVKNRNEKEHENELDDNDGLNSGGNSPLSRTFSFRNKQIFPPRSLLCEPDIEISWNNELRRKNESYDYIENEDSKRNKNVLRGGSGLKRLGSAMSGVTDGSNSSRTTCESTSSIRNNFPPGTFFSLMSKNILDRRRSNMSSSTYKGLDYDSDDEEIDSLYRVDHRRIVYTMPVTRPPFYPPSLKGIPQLYAANPLLKLFTPRCPTPPNRAFSTDFPIPKGRRIFQDDIPEKSLQRKALTYVAPHTSRLSYDVGDSETDEMAGHERRRGDRQVGKRNELRRKILDSSFEYADKERYKDRLFTLVFASNDFPGDQEEFIRRKKEGIEGETCSVEFVHWVIVNITGNNVRTGTIVGPYIGPCPPCKSGLHRHFFRLYLQEDKFAEKAVLSSEEYFKNRNGASAVKWCSEYKLHFPIAVRWLCTTWDSTCDDTHKKIGYVPPDEYPYPDDKKPVVEKLETTEEEKALIEKEIPKLALFEAEKEKTRSKALNDEAERVMAIKMAAEGKRLRLSEEKKVIPKLALFEAEKEKTRSKALNDEAERVMAIKMAAEGKRLRLSEEKKVIPKLALFEAEKEKTRSKALNDEAERVMAIKMAAEGKRLRLLEEKKVIPKLALFEAEKEKTRSKALNDEAERVMAIKMAAEGKRLRLSEEKKVIPKLALFEAEKEKTRSKALNDEAERVMAIKMAAEGKRLRLSEEKKVIPKLALFEAEKEKTRSKALNDEAERVMAIKMAAEGKRLRLLEEKKEIEEMKAAAVQVEMENIRLENEEIKRKERLRLFEDERQRVRLQLLSIEMEEERKLLEMQAEKEEMLRLLMIEGETERLRFESAEAEKERIRIEKLGTLRVEDIAKMTETERLRFAEIEVEQERIRLEREGKEERERLQVAGIEVEQERIRLEREGKEERERLRAAEIEVEQERIRLEREGKKERERLQVAAIEVEQERIRLEREGKEERESLQVAAIEVEQERVRLEREGKEERERLQVAAIEVEQERVRLEREGKEERERMQVAAIEVEQERVRLEREGKEERERLQVAAIEVEQERIRLEREGKEETERLRAAAIEVEQERVRLEREGKEERERLQVAETEVEQERIRLEREGKEERERMQVAAIEVEQERVRLEREGKEERERLQVAGIEVEQERIRLEIEKERIRLEIEKERIRLEIEKERIRLEIEKERIRLEIEKERIRLEVEKERLRIAKVEAEKEKSRIEIEGIEMERLESIKQEKEKEKENPRLDAIAITEKEKLKAAEKGKKWLEVVAAREKERHRLSVESAELRRSQILGIPINGKGIRKIDDEKVEKADSGMNNKDVNNKDVNNKDNKDNNNKDNNYKDNNYKDNYNKDNNNKDSNNNHVSSKLNSSSHRTIHQLEEMNEIENARIELPVQSSAGGKSRNIEVKGDVFRKEDKAQIMKSYSLNEMDIRGTGTDKKEAEELRRLREKVERLQNEVDLARAQRAMEDEIIEDNKPKLLTDQVKEAQILSGNGRVRDRVKGGYFMTSDIHNAKEESNKSTEHRKLEDGEKDEAKGEDEKEKEDKKKQAEIDEAERKAKFLRISSRWSSPLKNDDEGEVKNTEKNSLSALETDASVRRQREYKERSERVAKSRLEKEAKEKLERMEIIRKENIAKEIELKKLKDLEDRTAFVFEVVFPSNQTLSLALSGIKVSCFKSEETKTGCVEGETVMDCCLVTSSKNNNLPSNILPGDLLVTINQERLYTPQRSSGFTQGFADQMMARVGEAEEPRTAMVFRLLRKTSHPKRGSPERPPYIEDSAEHSYARTIPLSLRCSRNGKVLTLSDAETTLFLEGISNSCN